MPGRDPLMRKFGSGLLGFSQRLALRLRLLNRRDRLLPVGISTPSAFTAAEAAVQQPVLPEAGREHGDSDDAAGRLGARRPGLRMRGRPPGLP